MAVAPLAVAVRVDSTGGKGLGVFAETALTPGQLVCFYQGETLSLAQATLRGGAYLFEVEDGRYTEEGDYIVERKYIDGLHSNHFSRYINHNECGNLAVTSEDGNLALRALRHISPGEELSFDYGVDYWACSTVAPAPGTDSRHNQIALRRAIRSFQCNRQLSLQSGLLFSFFLPVLLPICSGWI